MEGIAALAKGLASCPHLRVLNLQDNTATESGTRAIAQALSSWPDLHTLNLSDCLLSPRGSIALTTALGKGSNKKLEVLKLQYAEMDARGINLLAGAIKEHMPLLSALELNGNRADAEDECVKNVKDALEGHGHEDALDELDDMEEPVSEDEGEQDVLAGDAEASDEEAEDKGKEPKEDGMKAKVDNAVDALADLMGKASIGS